MRRRSTLLPELQRAGLLHPGGRRKAAPRSCRSPADEVNIGPGYEVTRDGTPMIETVIVFLLAAAVAVPVFARLGLGAVLGYLAAGVLIGPWVLGIVTDAEEVLHIAELGVVLLLFIIGLELRPSRLWALRRAIFGFGSAQLLLTGLLIAAAGWAAGLAPTAAVLTGLVLALSSTAFALQLMAERGELTSRWGRTAFATLLFQDLAVVPLLALVPLLGGGGNGDGFSIVAAAEAIAVLGVVVVGGRYLLRYLLRLAAASHVREVLTATALLAALGTAHLVELAGLSMALGAFMAGVLLADSEFRHQLEADIEPFKGLLLGLFFIAVGISLNLGLFGEAPLRVAVTVLVIVSLKFAVLFVLGRWQGLDSTSARRLGLVLSQGGEFAFVLFGVAVGAGVIAREASELLTVAVSLSMALTPLLLLADGRLSRRRADAEDFDTIPDQHHPVIIAGFGRFGQIIARVLRAKRIPFTALDFSHEQVDFVRRYGNEIYYGDASRLDLLEAAGAANAKLLVLAVDDVDASLRTATIVREHFPHLRIYARARNRKHAYRLMDLGVEVLRRDTFLSALDLSTEVLKGLGVPGAQAERAAASFREHDERRLHEHRHLHDDEEKMRDLAKAAARELEEMFERDERELGGKQ